MKRLPWILILLLIGATLWWLRHSEPAATPPVVPSPLPSPAEPAPPVQPAPTYYPPLDQLNSPTHPVERDLIILRDLFFSYQTAIKDPSGNPVGTHAEIVRALQGHNRARLAFLPARHPALNERGELVDRWGTPYFFHALSGASMEIRSAGPDRILYTTDDALWTPPSPHRPK